MKRRVLIATLTGSMAIEAFVWWLYTAFGGFGDLGPTNAVSKFGTVFHAPGMILVELAHVSPRFETAFCVVTGTIEWFLVLSICGWTVVRIRNMDVNRNA